MRFNNITARSLANLFKTYNASTASPRAQNKSRNSSKRSVHPCFVWLSAPYLWLATVCSSFWFAVSFASCLYERIWNAIYHLFFAKQCVALQTLLHVSRGIELKSLCATSIRPQPTSPVSLKWPQEKLKSIGPEEGGSGLCDEAREMGEQTASRDADRQRQVVSYALTASLQKRMDFAALLSNSEKQTRLIVKTRTMISLSFQLQPRNRKSERFCFSFDFLLSAQREKKLRNSKLDREASAMHHPTGQRSASSRENFHL